MKVLKVYFFLKSKIICTIILFFLKVKFCLYKKIDIIAFFYAVLHLLIN